MSLILTSTTSRLTDCIQFVTLHGEKVLQATIARLRMAISDQNLELIPDYEQRVDVLKELKFIDANSTVLLKGRVACEVSHDTSRSLHKLVTLISDLTDQLRQRTCPHRAHPRKHSCRLRTRRSRRSSILLHLPRKDRRRTCSPS